MVDRYRKKMYLNDHECTLRGFLQVEMDELRVEDGDLEADGRVLLCKLTMLDVLFLKKFVSQTSWRGLQTEHITM